MAKNKVTLEGIETEIKKLIEERDEVLKKANDIQGDIFKKLDKYNELHPDYVKIQCITCKGTGSKRSADGKLKVCEQCGGKCYLWMKRYSEVKE